MNEFKHLEKEVEKFEYIRRSILNGQFFQANKQVKDLSRKVRMKLIDYLWFENDIGAYRLVVQWCVLGEWK